jgi:molecular chaperone HtpG
MRRSPLKIEQEYQPVCKKIKEVFETKVEKVIVGQRLEDSPCV